MFVAGQKSQKKSSIVRIPKEVIITSEGALQGQREAKCQSGVSWAAASQEVESTSTDQRNVTSVAIALRTQSTYKVLYERTTIC